MLWHNKESAAPPHVELHCTCVLGFGWLGVCYLSDLNIKLDSD